MITKFRNTDLGSTVAAIAFTLVFSTVCVLGAVGPAAAGQLTETAVHAVA